jgi:two-component system alkaline phosphatase synthesis response regulator PhoP
MSTRILLAEDEINLRETITLNLELDGYEVVAVENGVKALDHFNNEHFNLVVLDVMLPEMDGFQVCEQIRLHDFDVPILFLTAKNTSKDKITGLQKGADDYLTKPFNLEEFLLRVKVLIKRSKKGTEEESTLESYSFGSNQVNFATFEAVGTNGDFTLTRKEAMLLKLLIDRRNQVVSRQQILQSVWGYDVFPTTRTIDNFILSFRKHFESDPKKPLHFHSVRGVGYRFTD